MPRVVARVNNPRTSGCSTRRGASTSRCPPRTCSPPWSRRPCRSAPWCACSRSRAAGPGCRRSPSPRTRRPHGKDLAELAAPPRLHRGRRPPRGARDRPPGRHRARAPATRCSCSPPPRSRTRSSPSSSAPTPWRRRPASEREPGPQRRPQLSERVGGVEQHEPPALAAGHARRPERPPGIEAADALAPGEHGHGPPGAVVDGDLERRRPGAGDHLEAGHLAADASPAPAPRPRRSASPARGGSAPGGCSAWSSSLVRAIRRRSPSSTAQRRTSARGDAHRDGRGDARRARGRRYGDPAAAALRSSDPQIRRRRVHGLPGQAEEEHRGRHRQGPRRRDRARRQDRRRHRQGRRHRRRQDRRQAHRQDRQGGRHGQGPGRQAQGRRLK